MKTVSIFFERREKYSFIIIIILSTTAGERRTELKVLHRETWRL